jgi:hypothetical protein
MAAMMEHAQTGWSCSNYQQEQKKADRMRTFKQTFQRWTAAGWFQYEGLQLGCFFNLVSLVVDTRATHVCKSGF